MFGPWGKGQVYISCSWEGVGQQFMVLGGGTGLQFIGQGGLTLPPCTQNHRHEKKRLLPFYFVPFVLVDNCDILLRKEKK